MGKHGAPRTGGSIIALGVGSQVAAQLAVSGLGILLLKVVTNSLGPYSYGVYATAIAFVSTFALFTDLGLNAITPREIAKDPGNAQEIIGQNMGLRLSLCFLSIPIIYGISFAFYPDSTDENLRTAILVLSTFLIFDSIRQITAAHFVAHKRLHLAALIITAQQVVLVLLSMAVAKFSGGLLGFAWAYVAMNFFGAALSVVVVNRWMVPWPRWKVRSWPAIFKASVAVGLMQIINMLYLRADTIMISLLKTTTDVGIYAIAYLLLSAFGAFPSYVMTALVPTLANATMPEVKLVLERACAYVSLLAGALVVVGVSQRYELVSIVSSSSYNRAATPFAILLCATSCTYLTTVFSFASVTIGRHHRLVIASLACLGLNIAINLVTIPLFSVDGAAAATACCEVVSLVVVYRIFRHETGQRIRFTRGLILCSIAAVVSLAVSLTLESFWHPGGLLGHLVIFSSISMVIYLLIALCFRAVPPEILTSVPFLRNRSRHVGQRQTSVAASSEASSRREYDKPPV